MININLIAERRARKIREMTILRMSSFGIITLVIAMVLLNIYAWLMHLTANSDLERVTRDWNDLQPKYKELLQIQDEIAARKPVVRLLEQVQVSEGAWMIMFADLCKVVPKDMVLDGVRPSGGTDGMALSIGGTARDEKTVATFMLNLRQQTAWANTPVLKSFAKQGGENAAPGAATVHFELLVPVRGLVGGDL